MKLNESVKSQPLAFYSFPLFFILKLLIELKLSYQPNVFFILGGRIGSISKFVNITLQVQNYCHKDLSFFMQVARHTRPEGHFKMWATMNFWRACWHLLLLPDVGLGFQQKALPPKLYEAVGVKCLASTTRTQTHTLLTKHQSLNLAVLLTTRPWNGTWVKKTCVFQFTKSKKSSHCWLTRVKNTQ